MLPGLTSALFGMIVLATVVVFAIYFKWLFSDSLYFGKHSLAYRLLVPEAVGQAPVFGDDARYYYSAGDGSWVGGSGVSFVTRESREVLVARYREYYTARGGRIVVDGNDWRIELANGDRLRLRIIGKGDRRRVEIMRFRRETPTTRNDDHAMAPGYFPSASVSPADFLHHASG